MARHCCVHFGIQQYSEAGSGERVRLFCGNGFCILHVFRIYCRIFSSALCNDMGGAHCCISVPGVYMLVCQRNRPAAIISSLIVGTVDWATVHIGMGYISVTSILDVIMLVISIAVLWRNTVKQSLLMLGLGVLTLMVLQFVMPFGF